MMKNVGIILELEHGKIKDANFGMITLAKTKGITLFALVVNADAGALKKDLESFGINKIVDISISKDLQNNPDIHAKTIISAVKTYNLQALFGLSTAMGKDLLPRIAARLEAPLIMDCFFIDLEKNLAKTSQYSGKTIATIKLTGEVLIFGVRPNAVEPEKAPVLSEILVFEGTHMAFGNLKVIRAGGTDAHTDISLVEADVIISGGRGMKNSANFTLLSHCAGKLKAAVGASRVAVDEGWVPYAMQVGQTGEKVSPRVYIACGISGSIQHFAGMKTSGLIIAVNLDENAPIMSNCDYYVKADALKIIPELTKQLDNDGFKEK